MSSYANSAYGADFYGNITKAEVLALLKEAADLHQKGIAILKTTTVGYANHSVAWQNNATTKWYQGLACILQANEIIKALEQALA